MLISSHAAVGEGRSCSFRSTFEMGPGMNISKGGPSGAALGAGLIKDNRHGEAEDVVAHAGFGSGSFDLGFEVAVNEAAEEDFVFGAFVRHGEEGSRKGRKPKGEIRNLKSGGDTNFTNGNVAE